MKQIMTIYIHKNTPDCIVEKIESIIAGEVENPPSMIFSYQYKGQVVYYFQAKCCDIPSNLLDEECNYICSPDGGLTGKGDGNCLDFHDLQTDEKFIWKEKRDLNQ